MSGIPVIDLFAGPGGLGEGFSSLDGSFDIKLSIEKDENAHQTLELRSFYRQFIKANKPIPEEYYDVLRATSIAERQKLHKRLFEQYNESAKAAREESWLCELGSPKFPNEKIDKRIDAALGKRSVRKPWVLIGGPPCQAYSLVGRSRRQEGEKGLNPEDHRVHLYKEYLRIIATHHPTAFVMENVKGLLSAKVNGVKMFELIKKDLAEPSNVFPDLDAPSYRIYSLVKSPKELGGHGHPLYDKNTDYLIRAEEYGVPQKRHRVILLGIRDDVEVEPGILETSDSVSLEKVIGDLPKLRSGINRSFARSEHVATEDGGTKIKRYYKNETDSKRSWKKLIKQFRSEIVRMNGFASIAEPMDVQVSSHDIGDEFVPCDTPALENPLYKWYNDEWLNGAANHQSRGHLVEDLKRYLFASMYTEKYDKFPRMKDYAHHGKELLPDHENAESGKFADRFRVQLRDQPATTVTSHISKDGHYFIHYDPLQCRSLTVREAARIQTFPDNYLFCGSRTAQYHQVGNAVPPYLAKQIGELVLEIFNERNKIDNSTSDGRLSSLNGSKQNY